MGHGKPTLGYPSRTAAIEALTGVGYSPTEVAQILGVTRSTIYVLGKKVLRKDIEKRREAAEERRRRRTITINFSDEETREIYRYADRYGIRIDRLLRKLICIILRDSMVDAVLDGELEEYKE